MSLSLKKKPQDIPFMDKTTESIKINQLCQTNQNIGFVADILHRGYVAGEVNLSNNEFRSTVLALSRSIVSVHEDLSTCLGAGGTNNQSHLSSHNDSIELQDVNSATSSLTNSVHISDVTEEDSGKAQELSSPPRVSGIGESVSDDMSQRMSRKRALLTDESCDTDKRTPSKKNVPYTAENVMSSINHLSYYISEQQTSEDIFNPSSTLQNEVEHDNLPSLIHYLVDMCTAHDTCEYHLHCLVILEDIMKPDSDRNRDDSDIPDETIMSKSNASRDSTSTLDEEESSRNSSASQDSTTLDEEESSSNSEDSDITLMKFFKDRIVTRLIVIERPHTSCQLYVAKDLRKNYHFSCPTVTIPSLFQAIRSQNNINVQILFVPRKCKCYVSNSISVYNGIHNGALLREVNMEDVIGTTFGTKQHSKQKTYSKRSSNSISIGLQTMYSHEQHCARYCMLPHSKPHIPTVKQHPMHLRKLLLSGYTIFDSLLQHDDGYTRENHPFFNGINSAHDKELLSSRNSLRNKLLQHLLNNDVGLDDEYGGILPDVMFESCSAQLTGALRCHKDVMNCPAMDRTIALHIPFMSNVTDGHTCVSLMYYTRKCVGDYAGRMSNISRYLNNDHNCDLTKVTIRSMMKVGCNFDYQSMFEHADCLNDLGTVLEAEESTRCEDIKSFCGTSCFKSGAAFDKMGYYSIFVNVFMTMFYKEIISNVDDFISLCMYFGLLCNGTSSLVAIWNYMQRNLEYANEWCFRKKDKTRLFRLLVFFDKEGRGDRTNALVGNCKLPRFQFANYSDNIIDQATNIHDILTKFLHEINAKTVNKGNNAKKVKKANVTVLHSTLFKNLKRVKGIGPLNFNQLWHSLCLCGLLPHEFIKSSAVGIGTGPAMLIQSFYPKLKSAQALQKKLQSVRSAVKKLGMNEVSEFFLENMYCEQWRQGMKSKLINKDMPAEERKIQFCSNEFQDELLDASVTKNPDIYYKNPFTKEWQHLFRVSHQGQLIMRPSFLRQTNSSSVIVKCTVRHDFNSDTSDIVWSGEIVQRLGSEPLKWFT